MNLSLARRLTLPFSCFALLIAHPSRSLAGPPETLLSPPAPALWRDGIGSGFNLNSRQAGFELGAGLANAALGSAHTHDAALAFVNYGWVFSGLVAEDKWYRGNWELIEEPFAGTQYRASNRYLVGANSLLRYNLSTSTPWVPFVTGGVGFVVTDIGEPGLTGLYQFDPQAGFGTHYFLRENLALTVEHRFMHLSNAGLRQPNHGINIQLIMAGLTWFF